MDETFGSVSRDGLRIYLTTGKEGSRECWLWIGVGDLDPPKEACEAAGAKIWHPEQTKQPWSNEMLVEALGGHVLRSGAGP